MSIAENFDMIGQDEPRGGRGPLARFFGVVGDPRAYGSILYLFLSLPLGVAYFTIATVGLTTSVSLLITIVGLVLLPVFFALVRLVAKIEGSITGALLGAETVASAGDYDASESFDDVVSDDDDTGEVPQASGSRLWPWLKSVFGDWRSYSSLLYMFLMMPLGVAYFVFAVVGFAVSLSFFFAPIGRLVFGEDVVIMETSTSDPQAVVQMAEFVQSPPGMVLMMLVGFLGFFLMMHLSRGIGWAHGRFASAMLVKRRA